MADADLSVLIVDDSAIARRILSSILKRIPGVDVAVPARNGEEALENIRQHGPDLVLLDIEMPEMNGFELLRRLNDDQDPTPVIVTSASADREQVFRALSLGAFDYVRRHCTQADGGTSMAAFASALERSVELVRRLRSVDLNHIAARVPPSKLDSSSPRSLLPTRKSTDFRNDEDDDDLANVIVAIAASTGGPPAITTLLARLNPKLQAGIVVNQHMPMGFTHALADRLTRATAFSATELLRRHVLRTREVLLIPGGCNLQLDPAPRLTGREPVELWAEAVESSDAHLIAPSADTSLERLAPVLGPRLCAVVLTGMGQDGARGIESVRRHGGYVICEQPDSSAVPTMPRAAIATGHVDVVAEVGRLAPHIEAFVARVRPHQRSRRATASR